MTDWFRLWHGAPTDPKWRTIAKRAGVRPVDVWGVVSMLMDRASQATERGTIKGYDSEVIADALGVDDGEVDRIIAAMVEKAVIVDGRFAAWDRYQPKREDGAADRAKAWRDSKKPAVRAPETGTPNATERNRTQPNAREKESRIDTPTEEPEDGSSSGVTRASKKLALSEFEAWYSRYPHKVGKDKAVKSFAAARRKASLADLVAGLDRYIASKPADREWCNPATWLNQGRWVDEPAEASTGPPPLRLVNGPTIDQYGTPIHEQRPRTGNRTADFQADVLAGMFETDRSLRR